MTPSPSYSRLHCLKSAVWHTKPRDHTVLPQYIPHAKDKTLFTFSNSLHVFSRQHVVAHKPWQTLLGCEQLLTCCLGETTGMFWC